jgi:hypothetical protein
VADPATGAARDHYPAVQVIPMPSRRPGDSGPGYRSTGVRAVSGRPQRSSGRALPSGVVHVAELSVTTACPSSVVDTGGQLRCLTRPDKR